MKINELISFKNKNFLVLFYIAIILGGVTYSFIDPSDNLNSFFPVCPIFKCTGLFCTGCGTQRSLHEFYNGNFLSAINQNLIFITLYCLCIIDFLLIIFNQKKYRPFTIVSNYKNTPFIILLVIIIFTIARNINISFFQFLAPS